MPERYPPDDPREWLNRARSDLALARARGEAYFEDLCFHTQQAAEKALKALLLHHRVGFPRTHDIAGLLTLIEGEGIRIPDPVRQSAALTRFAVFTRYPNAAPPVTQLEYEQAFGAAETVVKWASDRVAG